MSSSTSSATVAVEKATSDLLIAPDWTMNIDICDSINSNHWQAKDVVKAVKRRLQHKNARVQLLALTLLETMVKNCGDYVHFQIVEKNILGEMVKIVRKKSDMQVRDKILILLDSWQEAFGGPVGKYPQYYSVYDELRRSGVEFPQRLDAAPIFTPPATHLTLRHAHAGYGMPSGSSRRLDETMATEIESLSLSSLDSMKNVVELLNDMLQAVNPSDREAVKDEVIVDLVSRCRSNQKKLMQMLTTTGLVLKSLQKGCHDFVHVDDACQYNVWTDGISETMLLLCGSDEELLARGLELNDSLQSLLAKHDAIASGSMLPTPATKPTESSNSTKPTAGRESGPTLSSNPPADSSMVKSQSDDEEEEEDDFAQLARRHSKTQSVPSQTTSQSSSEVPVSMDNSNTKSHISAVSSNVPCNAITLRDPPTPVRTTKEQDMIDLLSITLSTASTSPPTCQHTSTSSTNIHPTPATTSAQEYPPTSQTYHGNEGHAPLNSYVVPWAQPQLQKQPQPAQYLQSPTQLQPQTHPQFQSQLQPHVQSQYKPQYSQYSSGYPPPPWAATVDNSNPSRDLPTNMFWTPRANTSPTYLAAQASRPIMQHNNSFPVRGSNGSAVIRSPQGTSSWNPATAAGQSQKPFIPSYRLFEDLNVLGNADGRIKVTNSTSPSLSGTSSQGMLGGRK